MKDTVTEHLTKPTDTLDSRMDDGQRELVSKWKNKKNPEFRTDQKMACTSGGRVRSMENIVRQAHACMTRVPEGQGKMQNRKYLTGS